jgi:branched-chain amino acid transport system ATP-binding protein
MVEPVLRAVGIGKNFGGLVAVDAVNLDLYSNEVHAVIGPNGAGKSTFLATLAGDLSPTTGRVVLERRDITSLSVEARVHLGIGRTYQHSAVIPGFAAADVVRLAALRRVRPRWRLLKPMAGIPAATEQAEQALARVGLSGRAAIATNMLSHGERRRLEIAAVLALAPGILLLDEPLAGLGPDEAREVVGLIKDLRGSCAIVLIEHDIDVVFALANRITVLHNGRVIGSGDPASVRTSAAVQQAYLGGEGN